jgi:SAM-dependent MidA family methyltransferase
MLGSSVPSLQPGRHNSDLCWAIAHQIQHAPDQRISFAEFMDLALYHPQHGYYSQAVEIGARGDFMTSPHLGADFGELLAEQFVELWERLDCPSSFTLLEMGAGQGLLAQDILQYLQRQYPNCFAAVHYHIVEKSASLISRQRQKLAPWLEAGVPITWCTWDDIPSDSIVGCCFSNELVDAFPVHQVAIAQGALHEVYVTLGEGSDAQGLPQFREVLGELSTPRLTEYFDLVGIEIHSPAYGDGYRTEVNLAALDWLETVGDRLHRGYLLTIDYGYLAPRYYSPHRRDGTLQCYYQHTHHSDPYRYLGYQDLTAHVDFTALQLQGDRLGFTIEGFTQQGLFLMGLGLGDRLAELSQSSHPLSVQMILQRREALHALINPMGLGNFGVLIQRKGLSTPPHTSPLKGLQSPL